MDVEGDKPVVEKLKKKKNINTRNSNKAIKDRNI